ncbi:MAG: hypothetical protein OEW91_06180 [Acidimicrobiia bacterium]|nr:hypothetical protein [Acidimicrobiia bacterium]
MSRTQKKAAKGGGRKRAHHPDSSAVPVRHPDIKLVPPRRGIDRPTTEYKAPRSHAYSYRTAPRNAG